jgi:hypothetical protein
MNHRYKYPRNWNSLKMIIRVRDSFRCTICGIHENQIVSSKGKKLSLHCMHIDGNSYNNNYTMDGPIFNNNDNNLASGCPTCHRLFDAQFNNQYVVKKKQNHQVLDMSNL